MKIAGWFQLWILWLALSDRVQSASIKPFSKQIALEWMKPRRQPHHPRLQYKSHQAKNPPISNDPLPHEEEPQNKLPHIESKEKQTENENLGVIVPFVKPQENSKQSNTQKSIPTDSNLSKSEEEIENHEEEDSGEIDDATVTSILATQPTVSNPKTQEIASKQSQNKQNEDTKVYKNNQSIPPHLKVIHQNYQKSSERINLTSDSQSLQDTSIINTSNVSNDILDKNNLNVQSNKKPNLVINKILNSKLVKHDDSNDNLTVNKEQETQNTGHQNISTEKLEELHPEAPQKGKVIFPKSPQNKNDRTPEAIKNRGIKFTLKNKKIKLPESPKYNAVKSSKRGQIVFHESTKKEETVLPESIKKEEIKLPESNKNEETKLPESIKKEETEHPINDQIHKSESPQKVQLSFPKQSPKKKIANPETANVEDKKMSQHINKKVTVPESPKTEQKKLPEPIPNINENDEPKPSMNEIPSKSSEPMKSNKSLEKKKEILKKTSKVSRHRKKIISKSKKVDPAKLKEKLKKAASRSDLKKPKTSSVPIIIICSTLIVTAIIVTAVGIYTKKVSLDYQRYAGRIVIPTSDEDLSLFNRETYAQPYHDNLGAYDSWNQLQR